MSEAISGERTRNYLRQLKGAIGYRVVAMAASFVAIPLMITYLGKEQFGVWSTLLTVMSWIVFFDLGVGNGLRNKVAESLAKNERNEAGRYIASGYTLIGLIATALWVLVMIGAYFVSWQGVFNTEAISESTLRLTVQIATFFIVLNFWVGLIAALLGAVQKTSLVALGQLVSNLLILALVFLLTKTTDASISYLALVYGLSLVTANILLSVWFYRSHPDLRPRPNLKKRHFRPLLAVGLQFFTIQLAVLVIFTTDKMLIIQLFGPQYVAEYEVVFKIFSVINLAYGLVSASLWSAYTDAYHRSDFEWIKRTLQKQLLIFGGVTIAAVGLVLLAKDLIILWVGHDFEVTSTMIVAMGLLVMISTWNNIFGTILGGIGKVRLGSIYTIFTALLNIPLSYYFAVTRDIGVVGIVIGTLASISISSILSPIQVYFFIYSRERSRVLSSILR